MIKKKTYINKHSKSSFYWGMRILGSEKRNAMYAIYAFCKEVDDIGDKNAKKANKKKELNLWRKKIDQIYKNNFNDTFAKELNKNIKRYSLKKNLFIEIINGIEMDIDNKMVRPSKKIFDLYCYRVAGAVGLLSLSIFGENNKFSRKFGLNLANAFQITNILRDIKEDSLMKRLYMPNEIIKKANIKEKSINDIIKNKNFDKAYKMLSKVADRKFKEAERYLKYCSKKKLRSAIIMMETYKLLLKKLKKKGWSDCKEKVKLNKIEKVILFLKISLFS